MIGMIGGQDHGDAGFERHTVFNAATGETLLDGVSAKEFDAWYDHHSEWRKVRTLDEVHPRMRPTYIKRDAKPLHFLVQD
jgi:hypothetical protein